MKKKPRPEMGKPFYFTGKTRRRWREVVVKKIEGKWVFLNVGDEVHTVPPEYTITVTRRERIGGKKK